MAQDFMIFDEGSEKIPKPLSTLTSPCYYQCPSRAFKAVSVSKISLIYFDCSPSRRGGRVVEGAALEML
ncbi:MAG: hypothetical protein AAF685_16750, partial [Cyanobacteria bacterium P01_C01_bin.89]